MNDFAGIILGITEHSQANFRIIGHSKAQQKNNQYLIDTKISDMRYKLEPIIKKRRGWL